jgi:signal transduction histidine kinase
MEKACMQCHSSYQNAPERLVQIYGNTKSFNRKVGDVISVVSIRIPLSQAFIRANKNILIISISISLIVFIIIILYIFIQKRLIFNPIEVLQKQSIAISRDNSLLGETIKIEATKDLTDFIDSFNIMSSKLHESKLSLEDKVKEKTIDLENKIDEVNRLNNDKDRFITILAHDLKNPFSSILGFLKLLIKNIDNYDVDKIAEQLNIINNSAIITYNLLEDILLWARVQSGKLPFVPEKLNFLEVCGKVIENFRLNDKNIIINHFAPQEIEFYADINMFKTILRNLLSNAIKFTENGGEINIYGEQNKSEILVSVSDTGIGIDPEILTKLFDFKQMTTSSGTLGEQGTGLGLLLCKEFVEKHHGKIWVESEVGKGSEFKFTMPLFTH